MASITGDFVPSMANPGGRHTIVTGVAQHLIRVHAAQSIVDSSPPAAFRFRRQVASAEKESNPSGFVPARSRLFEKLMSQPRTVVARPDYEFHSPKSPGYRVTTGTADTAGAGDGGDSEGNSKGGHVKAPASGKSAAHRRRHRRAASKGSERGKAAAQHTPASGSGVAAARRRTRPSTATTRRKPAQSSMFQARSTGRGRAGKQRRARPGASADKTVLVRALQDAGKPLEPYKDIITSKRKVPPKSTKGRPAFPAGTSSVEFYRRLYGSSTRAKATQRTPPATQHAPTNGARNRLPRPASASRLDGLRRNVTPFTRAGSTGQVHFPSHDGRHQLVPPAAADVIDEVKQRRAALRKQRKDIDSGHPPLRVYKRGLPPLFTELYVRFLTMLKVLPRDEMEGMLIDLARDVLDNRNSAALNIDLAQREWDDYVALYGPPSGRANDNEAAPITAQGDSTLAGGQPQAPRASSHHGSTAGGDSADATLHDDAGDARAQLDELDADAGVYEDHVDALRAIEQQAAHGSHAPSQDYHRTSPVAEGSHEDGYSSYSEDEAFSGGGQDSRPATPS